MGIKKRLSQEESPELSYFELQAYWGVTKHIGSLKATEELIELCHISENKCVLDVGCGVGVTSCYLAKRHGCRVVGVDISERMIDRSNERARREGIESRVAFRVADAQNLPFGDNLFDAVISESVTVFVEDKRKAINEYVRVTKPGGYIGLNECTWIKTPPPAALLEYTSRVFSAEFLTSDDWKGLLEGSGLRETEARIREVNLLSEYIEGIRWLRLLGLKEYSRALYRFLSLYIKSPSFRKYAKAIRPVPRDYFEYVGYGIYVGRK